MTKFNKCSISGCEGNAAARGTARGFCINHYRRLMKYGDPLGGRASPGEPMRWLVANMESCGDECLIWPFARDAKGYGVVKYDGAYQGAHRVCCILSEGPPPTDHSEAAHSCGNGHLGCVNPHHLRWATQLENAADRVGHGRSGRGEHHGAHRLTEDDVRQIIAARGKVRQIELADRFGVSQVMISKIQLGKKWGWLR